MLLSQSSSSLILLPYFFRPSEPALLIEDATASTIAMNLQCISFWDCEKSRVTTARSDFCRGGLNTGIIRERHSKWSTTPFRQVRETHQERSGKVPTQPIRSRPRPIRNDRGSC